MRLKRGWRPWSRSTGRAPADGPGTLGRAGSPARADPEAPRAAVVGASFAGVKIAAVLHEMGLRVCLVEREPHILPLSAHPDCARLMETHLLEEGYELRLGAALARVETGDGGSG